MQLRSLAALLVALVMQAALVCAAWMNGYTYDEALFDPSRGGPIVVTDRNGNVLRRVPADDGRPGRERWVPLSEVSSHAVLTLLASEDQGFYDHGGVDPEGVARGAWLTATTDGTYGGSTITMQLARMVYSPGRERTVWRKLVEIRAAVGIERELDKHEILEQYLNRAYYGNGAYGIEAAAHRYFGKPAGSLSVGEATYLAVLPRGPSYYDPIRHGDRVLARREHLLGLLVEQGRLSEAEAERAMAQRIEPRLHPMEFEAPHFVDWVLAELPDDVRRNGGTVVTTLDLDLQRGLEHRTAEHVAEQARWDVGNAGAVILDTGTAEVLAMVGSRDYAGPSGQVNIVTRRRHPGSALKPFVYATAIEQGHAPATIAYDVRDISMEYRDPGPERGPVAYREALAGSYNFAAIHVIEQVGVEPVMDRLYRAGVSENRLTPDEYGSRLALGSTKVRLLDLAAGYRFTVRDGLVRTPTGIAEVRDGERITYRPRIDERRVFSPETSWLVMDMLSDPDARRPMFGEDLPVDLPYPVVAKTGTAEGFSDTVTVIATDELIVATWSGRFDGGAIQGRPGMATAGPLARAALLLASDARPLTLPRRPSGLVRADVCAESGHLPGPHCHHTRNDWFAPGTIPTRACSLHREEGRSEYPGQLAGWAQRTGRLAAR